MRYMAAALVACGVLAVAPSVVQGTIARGPGTLSHPNVGTWEEVFLRGDRGHSGHMLRTSWREHYYLFGAELPFVGPQGPAYEYRTIYPGGNAVAGLFGPGGDGAVVTTEPNANDSYQGSLHDLVLELGGTLDEPTHTPEPSALIVWSLLGILAFGVGWWRRRRTP